MTTSAPILQNEFLKTGEHSSPASGESHVIYREFSAPVPLPLPGTIPIDSLIAENEADDEMARLMAQARQQLAANLYSDEPETFSALRLSAGLSQAQLAAKAQTSQPYIARVENGQVDPGTDVVARIADAMGVDDGIVFKGIRKQRQTREHHR